MAREIGRQIKINKTIEENEIGVVEEIVSINHQVSSKTIEVSTLVYSSDNRVLKNESTFISGQDYVDLVGNTNILLSDEEKIWKIVDKNRIEH